MKFEEQVNYIVKQCVDTLNRKQDEYATDKSRFHNFEVAARMDGITPEKALKGMWYKHLVSLIDIINKVEFETPSEELLTEKVVDNINYILLLYGMINKRRIE